MKEKAKLHDMHFRLTQDQLRMLTQKAKKCGLSKQGYLIKLIEGTPIRATPSAEVQGLRREINYIGKNINQIVRKANAGFANADDFDQLKYMMKEIHKLMYRVANP